MKDSFNAYLSDTAKQIREFVFAQKLIPLIPSELQKATDAYFARGGKLMRPAIALACAEALGGKDALKRAVPLGAACEMFHLFTLVHDDVIDHDDSRRGGPSAHVLAASESKVPSDAAFEYGRAVAILAGDALHGRAITFLAGAPLSAEARIFLIDRLESHTLPLLACGETLDTKFAFLETLPSEQDLLTVYRSKTGVLFEFALICGAVAALDREPSREWIEQFSLAASLCGYAFQLTDDYLSLTESEKTIGKPALSDIREGKRTFFVLWAMQTASAEEKTMLSRVLGNAKAEKNEVLLARDLLLKYGEEHYRKTIQKNILSATEALSFLPDSDAQKILLKLFTLMVDRNS